MREELLKSLCNRLDGGKLTFEQRLLQDSGLFFTLKTKEEEQEENDVLIKK